MLPRSPSPPPCQPNLAAAAPDQRPSPSLAPPTGSDGYGFWYRLLDYPEGPSYTGSIRPRFTALASAAFDSNTAHSAAYFGMRIHPDFFPPVGNARALAWRMTTTINARV